MIVEIKADLETGPGMSQEERAKDICQFGDNPAIRCRQQRLKLRTRQIGTQRKLQKQLGSPSIVDELKFWLTASHKVLNITLEFLGSRWDNKRPILASGIVIYICHSAKLRQQMIPVISIQLRNRQIHTGVIDARNMPSQALRKFLHNRTEVLFYQPGFPTPTGCFGAPLGVGA